MLPNQFVMFYSIKIKIVKQISYLVTGSLCIEKPMSLFFVFLLKTVESTKAQTD